MKKASKIDKQIGYRIKELRESKHVTQQYIADELELSITAYGAIERGHTNITLTRLEQIAIILDVNIEFFFLVSNKPLELLHTSKIDYLKTLNKGAAIALLTQLIDFLDIIK